jgi:hypothetical protein
LIEQLNAGIMLERHHVKTVAEVLASLSVVFSIIWAVTSQRHQDEWQRKVATVEALEQRDRTLLKYIYSRVHRDIAPTALLDSIKNNDTLRSNISKQLRFFEDISIGANIGVYELDVIERYIGHMFVRFHKRMQPYILHRRRVEKNPDIYIEYDECVKLLHDAGY